MFCKIKSFLGLMGLKPSDISISVKASPIGIEDIKAVEQRKRIAKAFEQQHNSLQARALVAHSAECSDPLFCGKQPCFKWEPDKIVGPGIINESGLQREPNDGGYLTKKFVSETRGRKRKIDNKALDMSNDLLIKKTVDLE